MRRLQAIVRPGQCFGGPSRKRLLQRRPSQIALTTGRLDKRNARHLVRGQPDDCEAIEMTTGNLSAHEKTRLHASARAILDRSNFADIRLVLYDELVTNCALHEAAFREPVEWFAGIQEVHAKVIGRLFTETVRSASRTAEREMRQEMQAAQTTTWRAEDEAAL